MGACTSKKSKKNEEKEEKEEKQYTANPEKFVKVKQENIKNDYEIREKIAEGGFGSVFVGKSKKSGHKRAVKVINLKTGKKVDIVSLMKEVSILKTMDHPNIIKVFEVYQDESAISIVTELCQGGELFDRIVSQGKLTENTAAKYMLQMVSAVQYMHSKNIVHRDLKPENMLFESKKDDAQLKLIDFGTCKHFAKNLNITERVGSPYYMAPEVVSGNYSEKCDVWSLGVILFILLSGSPPFNGNNETEILMNISVKELEFKKQIWKNVSPEAVNLIKKMLTRVAADRPTITEVYNNPWVQKHANNEVPDKDLASKSLRNLANFSSTSKLHRATLAYIVSQLISSEEVSKLRETFTAIDSNGDGLLSADEIKKAMSSLTGELAANVGQILNQVDEDGNGCINYSEFLTAAINWEKELSRERLHQAFKDFDKDGSGSISVSELLEAFGGSRGQTHMFLEMIKEADTNDDGQLDLEEFCEFMEKVKDPSNRT